MSMLRKTILVASLLVAVFSLSGLGTLTAEDKKKDDKAATIVFEVFKDKSDAFRFRLKDGDDTLAISNKGFKTKEECLKVIEAIRKDAPTAKIVVDEPKK